MTDTAQTRTAPHVCARHRSIKYINRVEAITPRQLRGIEIAASTDDGIPAVHLVCWRNSVALDMSGLASMECESAVENGVVVHTATLTATLPGLAGPVPPACCFLMTAVDGSRWLMGTDMRPYPRVSYTRNLPQSPGDACVSQLTATWVSTVGIMRVIG